MFGALVAATARYGSRVRHAWMLPLLLVLSVPYLLWQWPWGLIGWPVAVAMWLRLPAGARGIGRF